MRKTKTCAATRGGAKRNGLPFVRAIHQFGPKPGRGHPVRLFLDDARNPPLHEKDWVVVRTVEDGVDFLRNYHYLITEVSLDNDLGPDPQGYKLLEWIMNYADFPQLKCITVHTGNLPKWRLMQRMLQEAGYPFRRRVPHDRVFPRASQDPRYVEPYRMGGRQS